MCPPCRKLPPRLTTLGCCSLESVPQMLAAQSAAGAELDRARDLEAIRLATKEKLFIDVRDQSMWSVHGTAGQIRRKPPRALAAQSAVPGPAGVVSPGGWVEPGAPLGPTAQDLQLMGPPPGPVPAPSGPRGPAPVSPPELCVFPKEATRQDSPMGPAVHRESGVSSSEPLILWTAAHLPGLLPRLLPGLSVQHPVCPPHHPGAGSAREGPPDLGPGERPSSLKPLSSGNSLTHCATGTGPMGVCTFCHDPQERRFGGAQMGAGPLTFSLTPRRQLVSPLLARRTARLSAHGRAPSLQTTGTTLPAPPHFLDQRPDVMISCKGSTEHGQYSERTIDTQDETHMDSSSFTFEN